jgi:hypothetical protein
MVGFLQMSSHERLRELVGSISTARQCRSGRQVAAMRVSGTQSGYCLAQHRKPGIERHRQPIVGAHHVQPPIAHANDASATNATMQAVIQVRRRQRRARRGLRSRLSNAPS